VNIFNFRLELSNPFDRWEYFKPLGCISGKLTKNKAWELEHSFYTGMILDADIRLNRNVDHAGLDITIGILGYGISFRIYDTRHWDYGRGEWVEYNLEKYNV
jgi:hypothetical protein